MKREEARLAYEALLEARGPVLSTIPICTVTNYKGEVDEQGLPCGSGAVVSSMGFSYEGQLHHGQLDGTGRMTWENGYAVAGVFCDGVATGEGIITWPNGDRYEGDLLNSVRHGHGSLTSEKGRAQYEGEWAHGRRNGSGRQQYPDGSVYVGMWRADCREGRGCLTYANGDCYDGEWDNGQRSGYGQMGWRQGTRCYVELYDGDWLGGVPHGEGRSMYVRYQDEEMEQQAKNDVPLRDFAAPVGTEINAYLGHFVCGVREGWGTFFYADGSYYRGLWRHGRKNGRGKFVSAIGATFYGMLIDDVPQGTPDLVTMAATGIVPPLNITALYGVADSELPIAMSTMNSLQLRFNTALKDIFADYASMTDEIAFIHTPTSWWRHRVAGHITIPQFLRLLNDAKIINGLVTVSVVLRCIIQAIEEEWSRSSPDLQCDEREAECVRTFKSAVYRLSGSMNFRLFTEVLVRLAPHVCVGPKFGTLCRMYNALVEDHLKGHLSSHPLCPVTRKHAGVVALVLEPLENLFNALVDMELSYAERFLSIRSFLIFIRPMLSLHGLGVDDATRLLFPLNKHPSVSIPPGFNEPQSELAHSIFKGSCAWEVNKENPLVTIAVCQELSLVDFIEAIVTLGLGLAADDPSAAMDLIESEVLHLPV